MSSFIKRTVSIILIVCLAIVPVIGISAQAADEEKYPIVYVPGLATKDIVKNPGAENEEAVFPPSGDALTAAIKGAVGELAKLAVTRNWDAFGDALIDLVMPLFEDAACNADGTSKENIGIDWSYDSAEKILTKNETTFYYDWRIDPMEIGNDLGDYIDYVLDVTGKDKVVLDCHSMGGIVTLCYFSLNGYEKVDAVVYDTTAIYGTSSAGKPFAGDVAIEGVALNGFICDLFTGDEKEDFMTSLFNVLYSLGVFDGVAKLGNTIVFNLKDKVYAQCLAPVFATMPGIWSLVPAEDYAAAKANCYKDTGDTYNTLIAKIDAYDTQVRQQRENLILNSMSVMNVGIFSRYNFYMTPVVKNWDVQSDSVVDTRYSSMGATCAPVENVFSDEYISSVSEANKKYISPDKMIDASTCLLPDNTWFFKDFSHSWGTGKLDALREAILYSDEQLSVDSLAQYPQFMLYSDLDDSLVSLTADDEKPANKTLFFALFEFIKQAIVAIKTLIFEK